MHHPKCFSDDAPVIALAISEYANPILLYPNKPFSFFEVVPTKLTPMKQCVIKNYGGPEEFEIREAEIPEPGEGEVLIRNHATSINPVDTIVRSGKVRMLSGFSTPKVIGGDFAGVVEKSRHADWQEGDEVYGMLSPLKGGAYSEYFVTDGKRPAPKPAHLSLEEAGVLTIAWLTAWQALVDFGKVNPGEEIFVNGCTGGVGSAAVQLGKALNARVTGTCSEKNMDFAKNLGTDKVIDYSSIPIDDLKGRYHLVFDAATKMDWGDMKKLGTKDARYTLTNNNPNFIMRSVFSSDMKLLNCGAIIDQLFDMAAFMEKHDLKPHIHKSFSLENMEDAYRYFEEESIRGKVGITI